MEPSFPEYIIRTVGPSDRPELAAASDAQHETLTKEQLELLLPQLDLKVAIAVLPSLTPQQRPVLVADHFGNTLTLSPASGTQLVRLDFQPSLTRILRPLETLVLTEDGRYRSSYALNLKDLKLKPRNLAIDIYSKGRDQKKIG